MLKAHSKVHDLNKWEFRPLMTNPPDKALNPMQMEAWLFQSKYRGAQSDAR
jgi:hypothetical protein